MRKFLLIVILLFTISVCQAQINPGINFSGSSWKEVLLQAEKEGKYVFLYAYTPSCQFCRQMEKEVFTNQEVINFYNSRFINYKINIEDGANGEALSKEFSIAAYPTYIYFNSNAKRVHQSGSGKSAKNFILDGKNAFNPEIALFSLKMKYDQGDRSPILLYNYSNALASYLDNDSPLEKVTGEYIETQPGRQLESEKNLRFIFTKYLSFQSSVTQYFLKNQEKFNPLFTDKAVNKRAEKIITQTANLAGRENNTVLFNEVKKTIAAEFKDTSRIFSLAGIYFYGGQKDWPNYAAATIDYADKQAGNDWQTLYETAVYLKYFANDPEVLKKGVQLMEKVIRINRSYENLCLYAHLQNKTGNGLSALNTAKEAEKLAHETGEDSSNARELITELEQSKNK